MYGHPSQRNASPSAQLPQLPTFPATVRSVSRSSSESIIAAPTVDEVPLGPPTAEADARGAPLLFDDEAASSECWDLCMEASFSSAAFRFAASSAANRAARPHVQSLQARRLRPGRGAHSAAIVCRLVSWLGIG